MNGAIRMSQRCKVCRIHLYWEEEMASTEEARVILSFAEDLQLV